MTVNIYTTPMSFRVRAWPNTQLKEAQIQIYRYLDDFTDYYWDKRANRFLPGAKYRHYDQATELLHLPRYDLDRFLDLLRSFNVPYTIHELPTCKGKAVDITVKPEFPPRDDRQVKCIDFLLDTANGPVRGIELDGGGGKTYITIAALARMGIRGLIRVGGLVEQWQQRFASYQQERTRIETARGLDEVERRAAVERLHLHHPG